MILLLGKDRAQLRRWAETNCVVRIEAKARLQLPSGAEIFCAPYDAWRDLAGLTFEALMVLPGVPPEVEQLVRPYIRVRNPR
jgi:molybdopterin-biosynthesis enzyme MoeA-like protein